MSLLSLTKNAVESASAKKQTVQTEKKTAKAEKTQNEVALMRQSILAYAVSWNDNFTINEKPFAPYTKTTEQDKFFLELIKVLVEPVPTFPDQDYEESVVNYIDVTVNTAAYVHKIVLELLFALRHYLFHKKVSVGDVSFRQLSGMIFNLRKAREFGNKKRHIRQDQTVFGGVFSHWRRDLLVLFASLYFPEAEDFCDFVSFYDENKEKIRNADKEKKGDEDESDDELELEHEEDDTGSPDFYLATVVISTAYQRLSKLIRNIYRVLLDNIDTCSEREEYRDSKNMIINMIREVNPQSFRFKFWRNFQDYNEKLEDEQGGEEEEVHNLRNRSTGRQVGHVSMPRGTPAMRGNGHARRR